jgi:dGTP triphosphohydrolase
MKKKVAAKKSPTSKSRKASGNIYMATDQVYQAALKSIIASLVQHIPREILIEGSKYINTIYPKLKDLCLNSVMKNDTVKRREIAWENVTSKILNVLHPLIQITNTEQKPLLELLTPYYLRQFEIKKQTLLWKLTTPKILIEGIPIL